MSFTSSLALMAIGAPAAPAAAELGGKAVSAGYQALAPGSHPGRTHYVDGNDPLDDPAVLARLEELDVDP